MKKIGLFCGCFDPVHRGHIRAAEAFKSAAGLERVYLVPANASYDKFGRSMAGGAHRLNMCRLAAQEHSGIEICDFEVAAPQAPYTIDTVLFMEERSPGSKIYLCMGEDVVVHLTRWACFDELKKHVVFLVVDRGEQPLSLDQLAQSGADFQRIEHWKDGISSSAVRRALRAGAQELPELDSRVLGYIRKNSLYCKNDLEKEIERL